MRFKNIRAYFYIATAAAVVIRFFHYFYTLDTVTGFVKPAYKLIGLGLLIALFAISFSVTAVCLFIRRCPVKMPRVNRITGSVSLVLALSILYSLIFVGASANIPAWQPLLLKITGALAAVFFGAIFVKGLKNFHIPTLCYGIPAVYYLVRLIYIFTAGSSLALVSDNLILLAASIFTVLFMLEFCFVANKLDQSIGYKKIAATGFTAVVLCVIASLPQVLSVMFNTPSAQRVDFPSSLVTLATGVFIYFFLRRHFSGSNLKRRRRHKKIAHTQILPSEENKNNFYMG